jgi:nicotinate-nucleotide adenylyltransferase
LGVLNVGFFGGAFDPPHKGHEEIVSLSVSVLGLDKLYVCPTGGVVGEKSGSVSGYEKRLRMATEAFSKAQRIKVVNWEQHEKSSYTFNTVSNLIKNKKQHTNFFVIMGMDSFLGIQSWKKHKQLFDLVNVVVFPRAGISELEVKSLVSKLNKAKVNLSGLIFVEKSILNVSSSEIRRGGYNKNKYITSNVLDIYLKED